MTDHIQLENQRLAGELDRMTRRYEAEADVARAGEHLYQLIISQGNTTATGSFGAALANMGQALRNRHELDGGGR